MSSAGTRAFSFRSFHAMIEAMFGLYWPLGCLVAFAAAIYLLLRPIVRGAIYFPTKPAQVARIVEAIDAARRPATRGGSNKDGPRLKVADLGSGDGRILVALAQHGYEAHGYEISPFLVWRSRRVIRALGLQGRAFVHWKDFWRVRFSQFDAVVVYGYPTIMHGLGKKFLRELRPGTPVLSNMYHIPDWPPAAKVEGLYAYRVPIADAAPSAF